MVRVRQAALAAAAAVCLALAGCNVASPSSSTSGPAGSGGASESSAGSPATGGASSGPGSASGSVSASGGASGSTSASTSGSASAGNAPQGPEEIPGISLAPLAAPANLSKDVKATVTVWSYEDPKTPWIQSLIKRFTDVYPNVTVNWTYVPFGNLVSKLLATATAGGAPDAVFGAPQFTAQLAQAGLVGDMSAYWNQFPDRSEFPDSVVWKINGKVGAVQGYVNTGGIVYNKSIITKAGVNPLPTTLDEFTAAFKKIKDAGYQAFAMGATNDATTETQVLPYFLGLGENYGTFTEKGAMTVFGAIDSWVKDGYLSKDATGWSINDATNNFMAGKIGFALAGPWEVPALEKSKVDFGIIPMAGGPAGQHTVPGGEGFSVLSESQQPQLAFELFQYGLLSQAAGKDIFEQAGQIPARKDLSGQPWLTKDPNIAEYVKIVAHMQNRPPYPGIVEAAVKFSGIVNALVGGQDTPATATQQLLALQKTLTK